MKKLLCILLMAMSLCAAAQTPYTNTPDSVHPGGRILNGSITKYIFMNDSATYGWYGLNKKYFKPDVATVQRMSALKDSVHYIIFGGSWCDDTHAILPRFFALQEASGVPDARISLYGVDRQKNVTGNISKAFGITNVPTVIVMRGGKEVGRLVEYGPAGDWNKAFADLLTGL